MSKPIHIEPNDLSADTVAARHLADDANWFKLIKELRAIYGITIYEAEKMALGHRGWRRWCNFRLKTDAHCRILAWKHIRMHGDAALFVRQGANYRVR